MANARSQISFAACTAMIVLIWCVMLPWLAARPAMKQRLDFLKANHIDPSAMFYTELEMMEPILHRIETTQRNSIEQ